MSLYPSFENVDNPVKRLRFETGGIAPLLLNDDSVMNLDSSEDNESRVSALHPSFEGRESPLQDSLSPNYSSSSNEEDSRDLRTCCICESAEHWITERPSGRRRNEAIVQISADQSKFLKVKFDSFIILFCG